MKPQETQRKTWLHLDWLENEAYSQPIQPVCVGDTINFGVTLVNLNGFVRGVTWEKPVLIPTPKTDFLSYDRDKLKWLFFKLSSVKIHCDLNRICQIEDAAAEWYSPESYTFYPLFDLEFLEPLFAIIDLKYTGVEGRICKCHLQAKRTG